MNISNQVRTLTLGAMLAMAVAGVPAVQAHAQPRSGGDVGISCTNPETGEPVDDGATTTAFGLNWECHDGILTLKTDIPLNPVQQAPHLPVMPVRGGFSVAP